MERCPSIDWAEKSLGGHVTDTRTSDGARHVMDISHVKGRGVSNTLE